MSDQIVMKKCGRCRNNPLKPFTPQPSGELYKSCDICRGYDKKYGDKKRGYTIERKYMKGISDDEKYKRWCVRKKGLKRKKFSYRKMSKEEAYNQAVEYLTNKENYIL